MTDYCEVAFAWPGDRATDSLVHYSVINDKSNDSQTTEDYNSCGVKLNREDTDCELAISCKSLYKVAVSQIVIVSEARVLEIYDYIEGYIESQKGVPISTDTSVKLCKIVYEFQSPLRKFYCKLKSLRNKDTVLVNNIVISLKPCDDILYNEASSESFNMPKLKHFVDDLGDKVPENAKSLLDAMEQYQKNKASTVDDIKRQLCQETTGQDQSLAGMSKMVAMFSQLNSYSDPSASETALLSMISSVQNGNKSDSEGMYTFLKTICGQVTNMRQPPPGSTIPQPSQESMEECQASGAASSSTVSDSRMDEKLQELEQQVLSKVDKKIDALEQRLSSKLDLILQGLNLQASTNKDMDLH